MDIDADGDLDILTGSYTGEIYFFERGADGGFAQGVYLYDETGAPLVTGVSVTPEAIDMDADGDLDLVIGTRTDGVFVFDNLGTAAQPNWAAQGRRLMTAAGKKVLGSNAHHADWDGDGVRDLITGSEWGGASWYRNIGSNAAPSYANVEQLVARSKFGQRTEEQGPLGLGSRTKVHVTDWNGDGRADLLIGDVQWLSYMLSPLTAEQEAEKAIVQPLFEKAQAAYFAVVEERNSYVGKPGGIPLDVQQRQAALLEALQPHQQKMATFQRRKTNSHGWVWLYLRESAAEVESAQARATGESAEFGPTRLSVAAYPVTGDAEVLRLEATLRIDGGWHVYATVPEGSVYPVTAPGLSLPEGATQLSDWSAVTAAQPAADGTAATWFVDSVTFHCEVRIPDAAAPLEVSMDFQVCDHSVCLPPTTLTAQLDLSAI